MKKYTVKKISNGVRNADNSRCYDNCLEFGTFKEMKDCMIQKNNSIFTGQGADIFMNDEIIANSYDWAMMENQFNEGLYDGLTLKLLLKEHSENN